MGSTRDTSRFDFQAHRRYCLLALPLILAMLLACGEAADLDSRGDYLSLLCSQSQPLSETGLNINSTGPVPEGCVKIEDNDIGRLPQEIVLDGLAISLVEWINKDGEREEFVGFSFLADGSVVYAVKAGTQTFVGSSTTWVHPAGTSGAEAKGISNITFCPGDPNEEPPYEPSPGDECPPDDEPSQGSDDSDSPSPDRDGGDNGSSGGDPGSPGDDDDGADGRSGEDGEDSGSDGSDGGNEGHDGSSGTDEDDGDGRSGDDGSDTGSDDGSDDGGSDGGAGDDDGDSDDEQTECPSGYYLVDGECHVFG